MRKKEESPSGCVLAAGRTCPFWLFFDTQTHILAGRSKEECCMRHLLHKIVTKKTERLRACLLLALLITAGGLALGGKETPPTPAAPAEAS